MNMFDLRLIASYLGWLAIFTVGYIAISTVLAVFFGIDISTSSMGTLLGAVAAMMPGTLYFKRVGELPSRAYSWGIAGSFVILNNLIGLALLTISVGTEFWQTMAREPDAVFFFVVIMLIQLVATRFFFGTGVKNAAKGAAKTATIT